MFVIFHFDDLGNFYFLPMYQEFAQRDLSYGQDEVGVRMNPFRLIPSNTLLDGWPCCVTAQVEETLNCLGVSSQELSPFQAQEGETLCATTPGPELQQDQSQTLPTLFSRSVLEYLFFVGLNTFLLHEPASPQRDCREFRGVVGADQSEPRTLHGE